MLRFSSVHCKLGSRPEPSLSHHLNILMSPTEKFRPVKCLNAGLYCSLSIINSSAKVFVKLVKVC